MQKDIKQHRFMLTQRQLIGASVVLALIFVGGGTSYLLFKNPTSTDQTRSAHPRVEAEGLNEDEVGQYLVTLSLHGEDLSYSDGAISIYQAEGHVYITQTSSEDVSAEIEKSLKRAEAMALSLTGETLSAVDGTKIARDVIWTVVNADGVPYFSVKFLCNGTVPDTTDIAALFSASDGYALTQEAFEAIGGQDLGIELRGGNIPQTNRGTDIISSSGTQEVN